MRYREPCTFFLRPGKSGKPVYCYRTYDADGKRPTARITGLTSETAARAHVAGLHKEGKTIPAKDPYLAITLAIGGFGKSVSMSRFEK